MEMGAPPDLCWIRPSRVGDVAGLGGRTRELAECLVEGAGWALG